MIGLVSLGTCLRPVVGHAGYDRAITAIMAEHREICNMPEEQKARLRSLRPRLKEAGRDAKLLAEVVRECDDLRAVLEREIGRVAAFGEFVREAFRREQVSEARVNAFLDQAMPSLPSAEYIAADEKILLQVESIRAEAVKRLAELGS